MGIHIPGRASVKGEGVLSHPSHSSPCWSVPSPMTFNLHHRFMLASSQCTLPSGVSSWGQEIQEPFPMTLIVIHVSLHTTSLWDRLPHTSIPTTLMSAISSMPQMTLSNESSSFVCLILFLLQNGFQGPKHWGFCYIYHSTLRSLEQNLKQTIAQWLSKSIQGLAHVPLVFKWFCILALILPYIYIYIHIYAAQKKYIYLLMYFFLFYVNELFACVYVCAPLACLVPTEIRRGHWIL